MEIKYLDEWIPVIRYDNAYGFCHCDVLHPDGTQDKTEVSSGNVNETFTYAIEDLRVNWEAHRSRFLREIRP